MITLYCFLRSGNSREVKLVLHEKGISFKPIDVHADKTVKETPEFKKASPKGTVPAIIDGDIYMAEAYKINEYLEDKYSQSPLLPKDAAKRAQIRDWVATYDKKLCLKIGLLLLEILTKPKEQQNEELKAKYRTEILAGLKEIDQALQGKEYFFDTFSLADISVTPHLSALPRVGLEIGTDLPNLKAWLARVQARPSFSASAN